MNAIEGIPDDTGIEVCSLEQACEEAIKAVHELRAEGQASAEWKDWRLEITDPAGAVLLSIGLDVRLH
jgi:hypothetical protein